MEDKVIFLNNVEEVKRAMGEGHFLQVNDIQRKGIHDFSNTQIINFQQKIEEVQGMNTVQESLTEEPVVTQEVVMPQETSEVANVALETTVPEPVAETQVPEVPQPEPVVNMVAPEIPAVETPVVEEPVMVESPVIEESPVTEVVDVVSQEPVIEMPVPGVEIVSETKEVSEYDTLMEELKTIDEECNQKIIDINKEREERKNAALMSHKEKIEAEKAQAKEFKEKAEEHLKNAEAVRQIAVAAEQNAINIQQSVAMPDATVAQPVAFPESIPTAEIPSLDSAPVLTKVA